jgi:nicotinate-nucleotide adenylyltransferase
MGGTFDPIHHGHLFIAEEAQVRCDLEKVIFFPNNKPAHREGKTAHAEPETRFELTKLAVDRNPCFEISRIEIDRPGPSYAIDTLDEFQKQMPQAELFYIVGADSIGEVLTWYQAAKLFEKCQFIAFTRPDFDLEIAKQQLNEAQRARVIWLETVALDIASRDLRKRVQEGLPIRYLVPDAVEEEIRRRGLYL